MSSTNDNEDSIQINISTEEFPNKSFNEPKENDDEFSHTESTTVDDASKAEEAQDSGISLDNDHDHDHFEDNNDQNEVSFLFCI